jgi:integrase
MADQKKITYEIGRFRRPSRDFPGGQWCVYVKAEGEERQRFGLGIALTEPEARAEARLQEWRRRRERAFYDNAEQTIAVIMEMYFADRLKEGKDVAKEQRLWNAKMLPFFGHLKPQDLTAGVTVKGEERTYAHKYAHERSLSGIRRATIHHELNILRTGMNWAAKPGRNLIEPTAVWLPRRAEPRGTNMSFPQLLRVLEECRAPHLRLFVIIAISTGARKAAILELTWDRVDFEKRTIDFRINRDEEDILDSGGMKGRAIVDMGNLVYEALLIAKRWATTDFVIEYQGRPVKDVHKALKAAMRRAGITERFFGSHAIRHSIATLLADNNVDLRRIQKLLGHDEIGTTDKIYASHSRGYLAEALKVVDIHMMQPEPGRQEEAEAILEGGSFNDGISGSTNLDQDCKKGANQI